VALCGKLKVMCKVLGQVSLLGKTGFHSKNYTNYSNYGNYGAFYNDRGHVASDVDEDVILRMTSTSDVGKTSFRMTSIGDVCKDVIPRYDVCRCRVFRRHTDV
jgi:hypothetical protein